MNDGRRQQSHHYSFNMTTIDPRDNGDDSYSSYEEIDKSELYDETNDDTYLLVNEDDVDNNGRTATYEEAFNAIGFGRWHFLLLLQCGWANASDAIEIMCISFTISSIHDSLQLSHQQLMWLTVVLFLGMMIGGYLWGSLADSWGRRQIVIFSLAVNGLFGVGSAFASSYSVVLALRFFSGVGAGGSLPVCFSYFSEFQPKEKRGTMVSALATFWMTGNLLTAGLAYAILPPERHLESVSPFGQAWRFFIIVCAIPSLSSAIFFILMPESPKFLMMKGRKREALNVLKMIYSRNNPKKGPFPYDAVVNADDPCIAYLGDEKSYSSAYTYVRHIRYNFKWSCICRPQKILLQLVQFVTAIGNTMVNQVVTVCQSTQRITSIMMVIIYFTISFSGYGVTMWLPTLMEKAVQSSGSPCAATNVTIEHKNASSAQAYIDVLIGVAAQLPANILTILIIDVVGGKAILVVSFFCSGISVLFIWLVQNKQQVVVMSALFNAVSTMVWNGLDVVTPELYETSIRASANGFLTAIARIAAILGNVLFGLSVDANCAMPILTCAIVLFVGGVASIFIPNTKHIGLK